MTKEVATKRAVKLQERLNKSTGGKWKKRVHENAGWHFNVYLGTISVSQYGPNEYSCLIGQGDYQFSGSSIWTITNTSKTPEECILKQLKEAKRETTNIYNVIYDNIKKLPKLIIN